MSARERRCAWPGCDAPPAVLRPLGGCAWSVPGPGPADVWTCADHYMPADTRGATDPRWVERQLVIQFAHAARWIAEAGALLPDHAHARGAGVRLAEASRRLVQAAETLADGARFAALLGRPE